MLHSKKIKSEYFEQIIKGLKPYEIRLNDCDYQIGDYLALNEIYKNGEYSGRFALVKITNIFVLTDFLISLREKYVVLTIEPKTMESSYNFIAYKNNDRFEKSKENFRRWEFEKIQKENKIKEKWRYKQQQEANERV